MIFVCMFSFDNMEQKMLRRFIFLSLKGVHWKGGHPGSWLSAPRRHPSTYLLVCMSMEKGMATHSSILVWRIPWTEHPGGLQSMGSQRVGHSEGLRMHDMQSSLNRVAQWRGPSCLRIRTVGFWSHQDSWLKLLNRTRAQWVAFKSPQANSSLWKMVVCVARISVLRILKHIFCVFMKTHLYHGIWITEP